MSNKHFPLPKRLSIALSEKAYANLRALNTRYGYGNNYLLTLLLENIDEINVEDSLHQVFAQFNEQYGSPQPGGMKR